MPSVSKKQQKFMGIVRAIQKGEADPSDFNKDAQDAAKKMKKSSVKKYAKTKHKGLPTKKVNEKVNKELKRIYQLLLKYGNSRKDAMNMIKKNMKYVNKTYSGSSPRDKAMALVGLSSLGESMTKSQIKKMRDEFDKTGELPPHLKKIVKAKKEFEKKFKVKDIVVPGLEWMSKLGEAKKRDYKAEYKKFQSSTKAKKYRAELNKYNRQKGTYGNGDGKDASHKGGKIVGFESQSTNRGRAEKSRLKKEIVDYVDSIIDEDTITFSKKEMDQLHKGKLKKGDDEYIYKEDIYLEDIVNENPAAIAAAQRMVVQNKAGKKVSVMTAKNKSYKDKDPSAHKKAKSIFQRIKDKFKKKKSESVKEAMSSKVKKDLMIAMGDEAAMDDFLDKYGKYIPKNQNKSIVRYRDDMKDAEMGYGDAKASKQHLLKIFKKHINEGTCGYGRDGKLGEEPAGPHLLKKKKKKNMKEASSRDVKRAIQIAKSMGGNMTGAVKKIEKMKKGLTKHKDVKNALKKANEGLADKFKKNIDKYNKKAKKSKDYLKKLKKKNESINEANYTHNYPSITAMAKDYKRIFPSTGPAGGVKIISGSKREATGKRSQPAFIRIEGDKKLIDAYKKIAFNGRGNYSDVIKSLKESVNEAKYKGYDYKRQKRKDGLSLIVPALRKTFSNMKDLKKYIDKHGTMESVNEGNPLELGKLKDAIKLFQKKIKKQGMVTNARDEEHLKRLMKIYNDMGGKKIKENNELFEWLYEACWKGYEKKGMKKMFGKMYPNCVKKKK